MLIDSSHKKWMVGTILGLATAAVIYVPYTRGFALHPGGGSALGLTYGIIGYGFILFAGLLGLRQRVPAWRLGRVQAWMRGHLWLGILSLPLIFFHSGFALGGPLTRVLTILLIVVVASGAAGAALQHFLPRIMMEKIPLETIYSQIPHVRSQLLIEADGLVNSVCSALGIESVIPAPVTDKESPKPKVSKIKIEGAAKEDGIRLRDNYRQKIRPFIEPHPAASELTDSRQAERLFLSFRKFLPPSLHETLDSLQNICDEERQLRRQVRVHRWLHGWLIVHIPLSLALLLLGAIHAWKALRY